MFSNLYIFKFATIMVVGVAAVLSAAAIFLKPYQDANIRIEKMQDILQAADIPATADNAIDLYEDHHLVQELGVNLSGEIKSIYTTEGGMEQGDVRAFDINIKELVKQIDDYKSGKVSTEPLLPVFIIQSSGGEKKKNEIFQMALLNPKLSILDETDSGLDIDALRIVANGVNKLKTKDNATVVITHYQRLLDYIVPDYVHVLYKGRIVKSGDKSLAFELEEKGYDWIRLEAEAEV